MDGRCVLVLTKYAAGVAGLVGGALSMACGEYISVSSQKDAEEADIEKERREQVSLSYPWLQPSSISHIFQHPMS